MIFKDMKLKMVLIDYPIYALNDPICTNLLCKSWYMKAEGYRYTYNDSVIPMDKSDFFASHIILCEDKNDELIPIVSCKSLTLDRCLKYNFEFPILSLMKSDGHQSCVDKINQIISTISDPHLISYDSAWAQNLNYRFNKDPEFKTMLSEIMMLIIVAHHKEFNIPHMITNGVVKVKTNQFFLKAGLKELNEHAHFIQKGLNNEESVIFYTNEFSLSAHQMAEKYQELWETKLVIDGMVNMPISIKAA